MAEEIVLENSRISNFEGLVTLTLDQVILHTVMHHSSTSTCIPNFTETEETRRAWTNVHTNGRTMLISKSHDIETRTDIKNPAD